MTAIEVAVDRPVSSKAALTRHSSTQPDRTVSYSIILRNSTLRIRPLTKFWTKRNPKTCHVQNPYVFRISTPFICRPSVSTHRHRVMSQFATGRQCEQVKLRPCANRVTRKHVSERFLPTVDNNYHTLRLGLNQACRTERVMAKHAGYG